jgi:hypothetical protein
MSNVVYSTDSDEHLENTGEKVVHKWCELTEEEVRQDIEGMNNYLDFIDSQLNEDWHP